jgi:hypothetical protein
MYYFPGGERVWFCLLFTYSLGPDDEVWTCACRAENFPYASTCSICFADRPKPKTPKTDTEEDEKGGEVVPVEK